MWDFVNHGFEHEGQINTKSLSYILIKILFPVLKMISEADLKIFHDILFAIDDEDAMLDMEEFFDQPLYGIERFGFLSIPPL